MNSDITLIVSGDKKITGLSRCEQSLCSLISKKMPIKICSLNQLEKPSKFKRYLHFLKTLLGYNPKTNYLSNSIWHFMDQNLALFLNFIPITNKILITVYDIFPILPQYWQQLSILDKVRYWLVFEGVKKADSIMTISEHTKIQISRYLSIPLDRINVFYEGVDHNKYKLQKKNIQILKKYNLPSNKKIILFVGSEQTRKNFGSVIKAFNLIQQELKDIILIKIGEPLWQKERIKNIQLIKKLKIEDKVFFINFVPEEELPRFYNLADLLVCLTLDEGGTALPIVEAMACGKPVIVSDIPVLRETIKEAVFVQPMDYKTTAKKAVKILTNSNLVLTLGKKSLKRSKFFRWEKSASKIIKIYRELESKNIKKLAHRKMVGV